MAEGLKITVVTVSCNGGLVYQKVYINEPSEARAAAKKFEQAHSEYFQLFGWVINVNDY